MISLGLDPSFSGFGWCVHNSKGIGPARIVAKGCFKTSPKQIFVERYIDLGKNIEGLLRQFPEIQAVGVESPPFGEQWSEGLYGLFVVVNIAVYQARKDVVHFDPGTVKMLAKIDHTQRKGPMSKQDMVQAARIDADYTGRINHNEADAYHIGRFAARFFEFLHGDVTEESLSVAEHQAFAKVHVLKRGELAGHVQQKGAIFKENKRFFQFSKIPEAPHGS